MPLIQEFYHEFKARQNCPTERAPTGRILFENGATSDGNFQHAEPPTDRTARNRVILAYWTIKLTRLQKHMAHWQKTIATQAEFHSRGGAPSPDVRFPNWEPFLKGLAGRIAEVQGNIAAIKQQLPPDPRVVAMREHQRDLAQCEQASIDALHRLAGIGASLPPVSAPEGETPEGVEVNLNF